MATKKDGASQVAARVRPATRKKVVKGKGPSTRKAAKPKDVAAPVAPQETPFELLVADRVVHDPRLQIGWRVPLDIVKAIREDDASKQALLLMLIVDQETGQTVRVAQPLLQQVAIVDYQFDHPGKYTVLATILWIHPGGSQCDGYNDVVKNWQGPQYEECFITRSSGEQGDWDICFEKLRQRSCCGRIAGRASIELEISAEFFSKEPPAWLLKWVDEGYPFPSRNECEFKNRALRWAFSIKLVWLVIWAVAYSVATAFWSAVYASYMATGLVFGCRGLKWEAVRHPWITEFKGFGSSWFTTKADGSPQPWFLRLLCPPVLLACGLVYYAWQKVGIIVPEKSIPAVHRLMVGVGAGLLLAYTIRAIGRKARPLVVQSLGTVGTAIDGRIRQLQNWNVQRRQDRQSAQYQQERAAMNLARAKRNIALGQLVTRPDLVKIELVPREQLSWYVRWLSIKTRVCRPFARRK